MSLPLEAIGFQTPRVRLALASWAHDVCGLYLPGGGRLRHWLGKAAGDAALGDRAYVPVDRRDPVLKQITLFRALSAL
jgi:hypothetical protein